MRIISPRLFRFFAIAIVTILSLVLNKITMISLNNIQLPKNRPEYNINNAKIKIYDKSGHLLYNISSEKGWQYPNSESLFLQNTNVIVYENESKNVKYQLKSDLAWINYNKQLLYLIKDSHLTIFNQNKEINIYGSDILININNKTINSHSNVKVINNDSIITSYGFNYDNNKIKLESNVKIIYKINNNQIGIL